MYITNDTKQYQKYFDAYKSLSVNIAKLLIRENNGNETELNESYLNEAWDKLLQLETKIAKVWIHTFENPKSLCLYKIVNFK